MKRVRGRCIGFVYIGKPTDPKPIWPYNGGCKNPRPLNGGFCFKCRPPMLADLNRLPRREDPGTTQQGGK